MTTHATIFGSLSLPMLNAWHGETLLIYGDGVQAVSVIALVGPETVDERTNRQEGKDVQTLRQFTVLTEQLPETPRGGTLLEHDGRQYSLQKIERKGGITMLHGLAVGRSMVARPNYRG